MAALAPSDSVADTKTNSDTEHSLIVSPTESAAAHPSLSTDLPDSGLVPDLQQNEMQTQQPDRYISTDPMVVELRSMFPDYDDVILQSVLETVDGVQARAVDLLLVMSDPEYEVESELQTVASAPHGQMTQTELDEQFARRLFLQDQEAERLANHGREESRPRNYESVQHEQSGDTMAEIQQHLNKFAESGKKTFGTIISKMKAKIQEFDQQRQRPGQGSSQLSAADINSDYACTRTYQPIPPRSALIQSISGTRGSNDPTDSSSVPNEKVLKGYDIVAEPKTSRIQHSSLSGSRNTFVPSTTPSKSLDAAKLGLLPKRPVSLYSSKPSTAIHRQESHESDDGLEYAENPFEEPTD